MTTAAFILISYAIGSLPFAVIVSRAFGLPDPRSYGSGNIGVTNVLRSGRKLAALLTLVGDGGKGWLAVTLAQLYAGEFGVAEIWISACVVAVPLGHVFPLFLRFKGGKGVATAGGAIVALDIWLGFAALATWLAVALVSRYASLASIIAALSAPVYAYFISLRGSRPETLAALAFVAGLIVWRHKRNILNLAAGKERKIGNKEAQA
jgi:glycerol-3-phosphate acyltransferase PlsY